MASWEFLLQGMENQKDHYFAVQKAMELPNPSSGIFASAFANQVGIHNLIGLIEPIKNSSCFYIGIRNGSTSKQAIEELVQAGIRTFLVDTGSGSFVFHPKVCLIRSETEGRLIVGSANFTYGGLARNIEASVISSLSLSDSQDCRLVKSIEDSFSRLRADNPLNVFEIADASELDRLVGKGLLIDERLGQSSYTHGSTEGGGQERCPVIGTYRRSLSMPTSRSVAVSSGGSVPSSLQVSFPLGDNVWTSNELARRDLSIPNAPGTNRTGSMLLNKGSSPERIDQRSYFRDVVFSDAGWERDPRPGKEHFERCDVYFNLIIKGVYYGKFLLRLSHNTRTDTTAYLQNNSMTQISWGKIGGLVCREDLLGCRLRIYAPFDSKSDFTLKFDTE